MNLAAVQTVATPRQAFGHPRGLWVLAGTELWDRISFHGMQAILTLYLVSELFLPGHIDRVAGIGPFRSAVEAVTGPLSLQAFATQTFGIYTAMVYATPLIGGAIGDRWLSRRVTVSAGALLMTIGHFSLAFDWSFLIGMVLISLGAGLLRANLMPQVKALYPSGDRRQGDAFQWYGMAVNLGAFLAPLITGALAAFYGWHIGFGFAGFGMLIGLIVYLVGQRDLADEPRMVRAARGRLTGDERRRLALLFAVMPLIVCFWIAQTQIWNTYNLWVRDHIDLQVVGFQVPVPWLQSLDGLAPFLCMPLLLVFWRRQAARGREPDLLVKLGIGAILFGASLLLLVFASHAPGSSARAPLAIPIAFHFLSNIGWIFFSPVTNALIQTRAPAGARGLMTGVNYLSVAVASLISGRLGGLYETIPATSFWLIHAAIVAGAGVVFLLLARPLGRALPEANDAVVHST
ncbi:peptide MFS transporter [Sphingomonas sp.]|uniref:peptide MFS transporter n=1 Tax=Sphingomonas sp. TaxID=28214 RepID=UPI0025FB849B|nr:peptide MFS transporter [Sphingomonas sp.]